jgi:folate-binding protein YgfZ
MQIMPEKTPLLEVAAKVGATLTEDHGWLLPAYYGNVAGEYQNACQDVALFDRCHHGKVQVVGKDARSFLHNLCTNEVNKLPVGFGCEAFLTSGQAKILAAVLIYRVAAPEGSDCLWLDAGPGLGEKVVKHLDRYLVSERVELADRTKEFVQLHLAGPRAAEVLHKVLPDKLPALAALQHTEQAIADTPCPIRRHDPLGLPGYDVLCAREKAEVVWQALCEAGARPAGLKAYHMLRVEAGTPEYGVDLDENNLPQEVGRLEQTVSFTKGCYIGQETVARIRTYGHVNRSLVGLKLAEEASVLPGAKLCHDGKEVGQVTSSVFSPRLGHAIALAYVRRPHQEPGTTLEMAADTGRRMAEVVSLPFGGSAGLLS